MPLKSHRIFLSSRVLLKHYLTGNWPPEAPELIDSCLLLNRRDENILQPDFAHRQRQDQALPGLLADRNPLGRLKISLRDMAGHFLEIRHGRMYVKAAQFEQWQKLMTKLSPLPLLAQAALDFHLKHSSKPMESASKLLWRTLQYSSLPSYCDPRLDQLISQRESEDSYYPHDRHERFDRGNLYDLHMHLNGTTEAPEAWLHSLTHIGDTVKAATKVWTRHSNIRRFYFQHDLTGPYDIRLRLQLGRWLQKWLTVYLFLPSQISSFSQNEIQCWKVGAKNNRLFENVEAELFTEIPPNKLKLSQIRRAIEIRSNWPRPVEPAFLRGLKSLEHPVRGLGPYFSNSNWNDRQLEGELLLRAIQLINQSDDQILPILLHPYLLLQNTWIQFLVQQVDQVGFEQFQHITSHGLRESVEEEYKQRFLQLHGMHGPDLAYLEGRFAPKDTVAKTARLLSSIKRGHRSASQEEAERQSRFYAGRPWSLPGSFKPWRLPDLALVAHFIKEDDNGADVCRHGRLRQQLMTKAKALVGYLKRAKRIGQNWPPVVGKDAANNETLTQPEVFAPCFRYLNKHGLTQTTYHVGEDYVHLVTGIRAVDEAIEFLRLSSGDRIGHGTALGINPVRWQERVSALDSHVVIKQGLWLDDLVWMNCLLRDDHRFSSAAAKWRLEIERLFEIIYQTPDAPSTYHMPFPGLHNLEKAWTYRQLDPTGIYRLPETNASDLDKSHNFSPLTMNDEEKLLYQARHESPVAFKIFKDYHNRRFMRRYNACMNVPLSATPPELILALQDAVIRKLKHRNIVVEVMPTSNVFISYYNTYSDHHIFDWLDENSDRPVPEVVVATDDPGIFATNLRNEYAHILQVFGQRYPDGAKNNYKTLKHLNTKAIAYSFNRYPVDID